MAIDLTPFENFERTMKGEIDKVFKVDGLINDDVAEERLKEVENLDKITDTAKNIGEYKENKWSVKVSLGLASSFGTMAALYYLIGRHFLETGKMLINYQPLNDILTKYVTNNIANYQSLNDNSVFIATLSALGILGYLLNRPDKKDSEEIVKYGMALLFGENLVGTKKGFKKGIQTVENVNSYFMEITDPYQP